MAYENSIQVLQRFANKQVIDAKKKLKGSANLIQKIKAQVVGNFERGPTIKFTMPKYAGFVDTGVKGTGERFKSGKKLKKKKQLNSTFANKIFGFKKQPAFTGTYKMIPTKVLDKWIIKKGIKGIRDAKGRFISRQGMKFAIAIAIYRQGLTGRGFFSQPLLQNIRSMTKEFEKALVKDIKQNLIKTKLV